MCSNNYALLMQVIKVELKVYLTFPMACKHLTSVLIKFADL